MTESDKWFGAKVKKRRIGRGMSAEDLGDLAGIGRMTVAHIESGYQKAFLWQAIRLAKILNINLMKIPLGIIETGIEPLEKE